MWRYIVYLLLLTPLFAHAHWDSAYYHDDGMPGTTVSANWMKNLLDAQSIYQVSIPGTHDSASRFGGWYVQTQTLTIPEQLRAGIRYLDIRVKATNGSLAIHHGAVYQKMMFGTALGQVRDYLIAHPSEFVVMRVKEEEASDPNFSNIVKTYMGAAQYSGVIWRPDATYIDDRVTVKDVRGKLVILRDYPNDGDASFGMPYTRFNTQDNWNVGTNWGLYGLWEKIRDHLDLSQQKDQVGLINHLVGSNIAFPYFIASGHSSPGTSAPRLATGLTTPGWKHSYPDFPRVNCFIGICTIAFEGTNILTRNYVARLNSKNSRNPVGLLSDRGYLSDSPYVGIVVADFPGPGLIETVVAANRFYDLNDCDPAQACVEYNCPEEYMSKNQDTYIARSVSYRSRYTPESLLPLISYFDSVGNKWKVMGPFKGERFNGEWTPAQDYYRRERLDGTVDNYSRRSLIQKACFVDAGNDPVWNFIGVSNDVVNSQESSSNVTSNAASMVLRSSATVFSTGIQINSGSAPVSAGVQTSSGMSHSAAPSSSGGIRSSSMSAMTTLNVAP